MMGRLLARAELAPDHAYSSSAVRARTTLELAHSAGNWQCPIDVTDALYGTTGREAMAVATHAPADVQSLMLVGHEPTWSQLAHHLTGGFITVKTATVIGIDLPIDSWHHADIRGSLAFLFQPRDFAGWL
jgi:phosphohistidine phosphatase